MKSPRIRPRQLIYLALVVLLSSSALLIFSLRANSPNRAARPVATSTQIQPDNISQARVSEAYGNLPLSFEANHSQTDPAVKFISRGSGYSLFLTPTEAVLTLRNGDRRIESDDLRSPGSPTRTSHPSSRPDTVLRMKLVGANPGQEPQITGLEELPGKVNYFIGNDPKKWRTNVSTYAKVKYQNVYPGVDLVYYGKQRQLEYDFVVKPGADPNWIRLGFDGAKTIRIDESGDLILTTKGGEVRQQKPVVYQKMAGSRQEIAGSYAVKADREVGFEIGTYDLSQPLVIDPVLSYSTYLGGNSGDSGEGITVDSVGNAYVTGLTSSADFPTLNAYQASIGGGINAFVTKLTASGGLSYSTYLGGSSDDRGFDIAVDSSGNAYVTGFTGSTNFPTLNAFQASYGGTGDAFVTKLTASGGLSYSTYLGGDESDLGHGITVDSVGNAYVTGYARSSNFPILNAFQASNAGGITDAFVTKLTASGGLSYSTYLGGSGGAGQESGQSIAVDSAGNAYVAGYTFSASFPTLNAFQPNLGGEYDAFVTKLTATGGLSYSTYLGGGSGDSPAGIAVDSAGNAYVAGSTQSGNFPTLNAFQASYGGAFVTKLTASGGLSYSTYLGGDGGSGGAGIAVDSAGNAYVTGSAGSNFPILNAFQASNAGNYDAFVTKLTAGGWLNYSTFLGGAGDDVGQGIAIDSVGNAYVTGSTRSTNFRTMNAFQPGYGGGFNDAFVAKIADQPPNQPPTALCQNVTKSADNNCQATVTPQEVNNGSSDPNGDPLTLSLSPAGPYPLGTTTVTLTVTDDKGASATCSATVTVVDNTPPTITPPPAITVNAVTGSCSATGVVLGTPTVGDNCSVASTTNNAPSAFPLGGTTVTWTVTDSSGNTNTATQLITVVNPNPVVTITGPPSGSIYPVATSVNFTGTFTDAGGGTHTASWMFDTISQAAAVVEPVGSTPGSANTTYTFTTPGVYLVRLTVNDSCGGTGTATTVGGFDAMVVVYDPNGGFVTGGGWINSPAGAYTADPSLTGKANFGFVSKYQNGASVPTGNTEFQFKAGNLNFKSTAYEWLVVAGKKAQYKGSGTINGIGDYRFMLTVIDGQQPGGGGQDKFRIRIWNNNGGGLVYDNQMNDPDNSDPTTVLGGGSIVIHKP